MVYIIISKGLGIISARKIAKNAFVLVDKYALDKKWFKTKREATKYLENKSYKVERNHKVVKMWS